MQSGGVVVVQLDPERASVVGTYRADMRKKVNARLRELATTARGSQDEEFMQPRPHTYTPLQCMLPDRGRFFLLHICLVTFGGNYLMQLLIQLTEKAKMGWIKSHIKILSSKRI